MLTPTLSYVNGARNQMFAFGKRRIGNIPQALYTLEQHLKRLVSSRAHTWIGRVDYVFE